MYPACLAFGDIATFRKPAFFQGHHEKEYSTVAPVEFNFYSQAFVEKVDSRLIPISRVLWPVETKVSRQVFKFLSYKSLKFSFPPRPEYSPNHRLLFLKARRTPLYSFCSLL